MRSRRWSHALSALAFAVVLGLVSAPFAAARMEASVTAESVTQADLQQARAALQDALDRRGVRYTVRMAALSRAKQASAEWRQARNRTMAAKPGPRRQDLRAVAQRKRANAQEKWAAARNRAAELRAARQRVLEARELVQAIREALQAQTETPPSEPTPTTPTPTTPAPTTPTPTTPAPTTPTPTTPTPTEPPLSGTQFGTSTPQLPGETLADAIRRQKARYGGLQAIRVFHTGLPAPWSRINAAVGNTPVVVSFKATPAAVAAGQYDAFFREWFASAPRDRVTWWTYYHEPEDQVEAGTFSTAAYRAAWTRLSALADEAGNPRLKATLILMCWSLSKNSGRNWLDYYTPGSIDVLGWDCYNVGWHKNIYGEPVNLFDAPEAAAESVGLPWGIAETGSKMVPGDDGRRRAAWVSAMARYLDAHGAAFTTYFDSTIGGDYRLTDEWSRSAWDAVTTP